MFSAVFNKKAKTPAELVKSLRDSINKVEGGSSSLDSRRKVGPILAQIRPFDLFQLVVIRASMK